MAIIDDYIGDKNIFFVSLLYFNYFVYFNRFVLWVEIRDVEYFF